MRGCSNAPTPTKKGIGLRLPLSFVVFLCTVGTAFGQAPAGPEFQVNTYTTGSQGPYNSIACDATGDFVVVWASVQDLPFEDIFGQRFNASGVRQGGEFRVNSYTTYDQRYPAVAADASGRFVVVWQSNQSNGFPEDVVGQRYDASGVPRGAEFRVNTYTTSSQGGPAIAADTSGRFVVVWNSAAQDGHQYGVFGQLYDASGTSRGAEFLVNSYTTYSQGDPAAAFDASGNFIVVWSGSFGEDGSATGVFGQRYTAAGTPQGPEFRVNSYTTGYQSAASVASAANGGFVVTWQSIGQDGSTFGVFAQRYDPSGVPQGAEFRVNSYTTGRQQYPTVSSDPNGNFVVVWMSSQLGPGTGYDVFGQRYDSAGVPRGAEFRVNAWSTNEQRLPTVASDAAGNFVVAWGSFDQDANGYASGWGVFGQRFGGVSQAPSSVDAAGNGVFEPGETVAVATSWRNVSDTPQAITGTASSFTGPGAPNNPTYTIVDGAADYGTVPLGAVGSCATTGNCYAFGIGPVTLSTPNVRPVLHWDATFREDILPAAQGQSLTRRLHVGDSFGDVPRSSIYYRFVETILHHDLTGGCGGGNFCPLSATPREQMSVFVLVAKEGSSYQPPACVAGSELFADVPASSPFCRWIEELAHRSIAGGCGGGNFCPLSPVSREQMTVFALATKEVAGYSPPACVAGSERFADVPASSPFCRWIEELARRGVAGGCGGGNFCPITQVSREQNSVFVSGTFALALY